MRVYFIFSLNVILHYDLLTFYFCNLDCIYFHFLLVRSWIDFDPFDFHWSELLMPVLSSVFYWVIFLFNFSENFFSLRTVTIYLVFIQSVTWFLKNFNIKIFQWNFHFNFDNISPTFVSSYAYQEVNTVYIIIQYMDTKPYIKDFYDSTYLY